MSSGRIFSALTFRPQLDGSESQPEVFFVWHQVQDFICHTTAFRGRKHAEGHKLSSPSLFQRRSIKGGRKCTVQAANTSNIQVSENGVSPQVQVVWDGLQGQSGKKQVNLHQCGGQQPIRSSQSSPHQQHYSDTSEI